MSTEAQEAKVFAFETDRSVTRIIKFVKGLMYVVNYVYKNRELNYQSIDREVSVKKE